MFKRFFPYLLFDADGGGNGGGAGGAGGEPPKDPPADSGKPPADPPTDPDAGGEGEKKFVQKDVDRIAGKAREDGRKAAMADVLKELGFESVDDAKTAVGDLAKLRAEQQTDLEKAQTEAEANRKKAEKAQQERDDAIEKANRRLRRAAVLVAAQEANFRKESLDDLVRLIEADYADKLTIEEGGEVAGVADVVAEIAKSRPFWIDEDQPPHRGPGTPPRKKPGERKPGGDDDDKATRQVTGDAYQRTF